MHMADNQISSTKRTGDEPIACRPVPWLNFAHAGPVGDLADEQRPPQRVLQLRAGDDILSFRAYAKG